ncbi:MAG: zinc dependent phospholipase C family protein [Candidatus Cloacimonadales bacterium]|nr:zinc dependent phospholipase C family protein [Candidatus Cloacimonadales bacterium]
MWIWDSRTHQFITSKALEKCTTPFSNLLNIHQELFILGIEAPDRIFKDFTNHYYNCTPNDFGVHTGSVINKIASEIEHIRQMLQNPDQIILHHNIAPFLSALLDTPLKAFIFEVGVLSHYVADLHQPMHTDGKYRFADEETVHKIIEADTRLHLNDFEINLARRYRISDPPGFFTFQIYEINGFYDNLVDRYYLSTGKVKNDRWENSKGIIESCLSTASQNITNVLLEFEIATKIFKQQLKNAKLLSKIKKSIKPDKHYRLIKYPSGSISLRRSKHEKDYE